MITRLLATLVAASCVSLALVAPAQSASSDRARIDRWSSNGEFRTGTATDVTIANGALRVGQGTRTTTYDDPYGSRKKWAYGFWTSEWSSTGHRATTLVPSWNAEVPSGTWVRVAVRVRNGSKVGSWDTVANWGYSTSGIRRTSLSAQTDDLASVAVDTVKAKAGTTFDGWQVRVFLMRPPGSMATPKVTSVSGIASSYATRSVGTSRTTMTAARTLDVPRHSQMVHKGHFPQYDGGGAAWCSPTSMSMVLRHFGRGPKPSAYTWAKGADGFVDHAARYSYDHRYKGTGNWSFATAYAGVYGLDSFVTRLYDLTEVEKFIRAGIPVTVSVAFGRGQLSGAPLSSTPGHLLVVVGFTKDGKVVVNDPAAPNNSSVRRTYDRAQLERAWLRGSGGVAYVARPASVPLPSGKTRW